MKYILVAMLVLNLGACSTTTDQLPPTTEPVSMPLGHLLMCIDDPDNLACTSKDPDVIAELIE